MCVCVCVCEGGRKERVREGGRVNLEVGWMDGDLCKVDATSSD